MNTVIARTAAPEVVVFFVFFPPMSPGGDGVLLLPTVSMSALPQVNRSAAETRRQYQADRGGPAGEEQRQRQRGGRNHITWNECDWTSGLSSTYGGPQLFFDYIVKGSEGGKEALQAVWLERERRGERPPALSLGAPGDRGGICFQAVFLSICAHSNQPKQVHLK